jgi:hypothetical protein
MTNLLQLKIDVRKFRLQPQCNLQPVCEDRVLFVWVDIHVSLYGLRHTKCERAIRLVYPPLFRKLRFLFTLTDKNLNCQD